MDFGASECASDFSIHQEELPEKEGLCIDISAFRYQHQAYCLSVFCDPDETCPIQGVAKQPASRDEHFCPDCGHALVWRVRKIFSEGVRHERRTAAAAAH